MRTVRLIFLLAITISLVVAACVGSSDTPSLDGRDFLSTSVTENGVERPLVPGTTISLRFVDGQLSASAGCNSQGGGYAIEDGALRLGSMFMTEMGCDPDRHTQDEWLSAFLGSRPTVELGDDHLVLAGAGTVIRLLDREVARPDLPLVGTRWTVDALLDGETVSSIPAGLTATLEFTATGQVRVNTSCNEGGAGFTVDQATMRISELILTERACQPPASTLEAAVVAVLGGDIQYTIDDRSLSLTVGANGLVLRGT